MIKAVLFDLDDTLFDHRMTVRSVLTEMREHHASLSRVALEILEREDFRLLQEKHPLVLAGEISLDEARRRRIQGLFEFCGERLNETQAAEAADHRQTLYRRFRRPVAGAAELLQMVRSRAKVGIITNNFTNEQKSKLEACGLASLIDAMVTSEEVGFPKPAPEIFQAALQAVGCAAHEAVMIGDSWEVDILGALNAGIRPVWFNREGLPNPDPAVREISALLPPEEILALLGLAEDCARS